MLQEGRDSSNCYGQNIRNRDTTYHCEEENIAYHREEENIVYHREEETMMRLYK